MTYILACVAAGLGACLRLYCDEVLFTKWNRTGERGQFPGGIFAINVIGSTLLGIVIGLAGHLPVSDALIVILGGGFLGGYTTLSTVSVQTVRMMLNADYRGALRYSILTATVTVAGLACGYHLPGAVLRLASAIG